MSTSTPVKNIKVSFLSIVLTDMTKWAIHYSLSQIIGEIIKLFRNFGFNNGEAFLFIFSVQKGGENKIKSSL